jgi:hypothetical protein
MGQTPRVDLGDQRVIDGGQAPLLNLQIPQHREDIVAGQGGQVQVLQFVDDGTEPRDDRGRNALITVIEHAFNIILSTDSRNHFRLIPEGIKRELITTLEGRATQESRQPATKTQGPRDSLRRWLPSVSRGSGEGGSRVAGGGSGK